MKPTEPPYLVGSGSLAHIPEKVGYLVTVIDEAKDFMYILHDNILPPLLGLQSGFSSVIVILAVAH